MLWVYSTRRTRWPRFCHVPEWVLPRRPPGDWTLGCIAVTDAEIEEIWSLVRDGTPIEIAP